MWACIGRSLLTDCLHTCNVEIEKRLDQPLQELKLFIGTRESGSPDTGDTNHWLCEVLFTLDAFCSVQHGLWRFAFYGTGRSISCVEIEKQGSATALSGDGQPDSPVVWPHLTGTLVLWLCKLCAILVELSFAVA